MAHRVNDRVYYGWVIVAVAAVAMFFSSPGQTYSISAFIDAYIEEFGFSRTLVSGIYSFATFCSGLLMIVMGKMVDRFGERIMLVIVGVMLAATTFFNSFVMTIPMLAISFFLSRYFGQGALTLIPNTLVPQWFKVHRGMAMSILKFGVSIAAFAVPIFNVYMINTYGWQSTWRVWSVLLLIVFLPLMWLFVINTPEEINLRPDNIELKPEEVEEEAAEVEANSWHVSEAMKTLVFWELGLIAMTGPMITTGITFHFYSIMGVNGIGPSEAAVALGLMSAPGFIMSLTSGYLTDRFSERKVLVAALALMATSVMILFMAQTQVLAMTAILLYGTGQSMYFVAVGVLWPNFFGRKYLGSIQGVATFFIVVGSAFGPLPFGFSFDYLGSYGPIFILCAGLLVGGIIISLRMKAPVKG